MKTEADDLAPSPALDALTRVTAAVTLDEYDHVLLILDEGTYQAGRILRETGSVELPNLGWLEIAWGDDGPVGRFTPTLAWGTPNERD